MPGKRNKKSKSAPPAQDEPLITGVVDPFADPEDGFDIADQLLASLDQRDAVQVSTQPTLSVEQSSGKDTDESLHTGSTTINSLRKIINGLKGQGSLIDADSPKKKVSRQQQRKERKVAEIAEIKRQAEEEIKANGGKPDEAEIERKAVEAMIIVLGLKMHEIPPDGHCLYSAVADQLNIRNKVSSPVDYKATRKATADMMRRYPDDFKPFISDSDEHMAGINNKEAGIVDSEQAQDKYYLDYCNAIENTGVWGGQPEILALSRAFQTQINVVQAGTFVLKVGEEECQGDPLTISYHRHMYGLGEHYNSLRPIKQ